MTRSIPAGYVVLTKVSGGSLLPKPPKYGKQFETYTKNLMRSYFKLSKDTDTRWYKIPDKKSYPDWFVFGIKSGTLGVLTACAVEAKLRQTMSYDRFIEDYVASKQFENTFSLVDDLYLVARTKEGVSITKAEISERASQESF